MKKRVLVSVVLFLIISDLFAQTNLKQKFIKGNISDKTSAVKEASGEEGLWLSQTAIDFVLDSKELLGTDRDLDGLAVAAIYSYPVEVIKNGTPVEQQEFIDQCITLFNAFNTSSNVQIAILSKILSLKDYVSTTKVTDLLNQFLNSKNLSSANASLVKSSLTALETIGNNESFVILYNLWNNPVYKNYFNEIENTLIALVPVSMSEILEIISLENFEQLSKINYLINKKNTISTNYLCEIAENLLNESILLVGNSYVNSEELVAIQLGSLKILNDNKWTRASTTVLEFFKVAKQEFSAKMLSEAQFKEIIQSIRIIAPLTAVTPLTNYLEDLNSMKENNNPVSTVVITAVINSLGAIGDKTAFDSLLAVTYLNYPESVLSAAREALAGLRW